MLLQLEGTVHTHPPTYTQPTTRTHSICNTVSLPPPPNTLSVSDRYGEVTKVHIVTHPDTNMCKGFAFISFTTKEDAGQAREGDHKLQV